MVLAAMVVPFPSGVKPAMPGVAFTVQLKLAPETSEVRFIAVFLVPEQMI